MDIKQIALYNKIAEMIFVCCKCEAEYLLSEYPHRYRLATKEEVLGLVE